MCIRDRYQDRYGWVSNEGAAYIASLLEVPVESVLGVVSFLSLIHISEPTRPY